LGSGFALRASDIPERTPGKAVLYPQSDEWINAGDSVVVAPSGNIVAGPLHKEFGILTADVDVAACASARRTLDTAGHYSRSDIFELRVKRDPASAIAFHDKGRTI
jgi:nitrilase